MFLQRRKDLLSLLRRKTGPATNLPKPTLEFQHGPIFFAVWLVPSQLAALFHNVLRRSLKPHHGASHFDFLFSELNQSFGVPDLLKNSHHRARNTKSNDP